MKTREDLEKLAREICWQWDFDCSKTLQSLDKVSQREMLAEAIFEALIKVQDEALNAAMEACESFSSKQDGDSYELGRRDGADECYRIIDSLRSRPVKSGKEIKLCKAMGPDDGFDARVLKVWLDILRSVDPLPSKPADKEAGEK